MNNSQLNLFTRRSYQDELFGAEYMTLLPYHNIGAGPIEFILKDNKEYIDLSETVLSLTLRVTDTLGKGIATDAGKDHVALINNAMHSVFSDVLVYLNSKLVDGGDGLYGYRSVLNTLFKYKVEVQKQQLFSAGFVRDDCRQMDAVTNSGFVARKAWTLDGTRKKFIGKLNCSLFQQTRLLMPGVDLRVKLERAKDAFALFSTVIGLKPKIVIDECELQLLTVKVNPKVLQAHAQNLARNLPIFYELNRIEMEMIPIKEKSTGDVKESLFYGRIPKYLLMVMVGNTAFDGDYTLNPYNFKHFNIKYLHLTRDKESVPFEKFEPNFSTGDCLKEYMSLFQSNDLLGRNAVLPITFEEFQHGYTNFQWNLSDNRHGVNTGPDQRGNLKLHIQFHSALTEAITVLLYGIFESTVEVYGNDTVFVDGS